MKRVPGDLGSSRHGKLHADEWRTAGTVTMVVSLIRQWGNDSDDSRTVRMLTNYIDLVIAIRRSTKRKISRDIIHDAHVHRTNYLKGSLTLYPSHGLNPVQHLGMHYPVIFSRFGPTHSWRTNAYERYNHLLQTTNSNFKTGACTLLHHTPATLIKIRGNGGNDAQPVLCLAKPEIDDM
jgi:hypothetical protein